MLMRRVLLIMGCLMSVVPVAAQLASQLEVHTEAQYSASSGDHTPLWLNANKYGLSSLNTTNGYVRGGVFRSIENDSSRRWAWGAGADIVVAGRYTSTLVLQQAYGELRWLKGLLTVGSKEQPMELRDQELSSGSQTLGINARPVPGVRLSLPDYWELPFTKGWVAFKGHIFYGMQTDDNWQKDFTNRQSKYTERSKLHTKAGYIRIGKKDKPFNVELGLEMACQFGGRSYLAVGHSQSAVENEDGLKGMIHALLPTGGESIEPDEYRNMDGNHLGSWLLRANYDNERWGLSVYGDHFFEDQSSMFFLDYDGYGTGDEWHVKKDSRYFLYDLKDIMLGLELRLKQHPFLNRFVMEYLYTKYQCGPVYHDHTQRRPDHISGTDNYYNHHIFTGWQHWGQVMGNPLYRSPLYNTDGLVMVENNRFWAWHLGVMGNPMNLHYRVLCSLQEGLGIYDMPLTHPEMNVSVLVEVGHRFPATSHFAGWDVKGAIGMDGGDMRGHNIGVQLTLSRHFNLGF